MTRPIFAGSHPWKLARFAGSVWREVKSVGVANETPGRPKRSSAPSGDSVLHEVNSVGVANETPGRPKRSSAPSGGSVLHEVNSVGVIWPA
jgi:hypothetical protein